ncbi:MAG: c-type cytochrome biogenesis protein CcmI [Betaproteobacteria bacterium]|nr:c-type cytochrome biogenesis protein CcmI [Betaproteobacteria bacterium]
MPGFIVIAALLIVVALFILLSPFRRRRASSRADRTATNLAIFRDQFAELEREQAEGMLSDKDFEQAKLELEKRLLEETSAGISGLGENGGEAPLSNPMRSAVWALIVFLPLFSAAGYAFLGSPKALDPANTRPPEPKTAPFSAAQIDEMVKNLAQKLEKNPEDPTGWNMLARSYHALGRYPEAAQAYEQLLAHLPPGSPPNAEILLDYAESLAATQQDFSGKPTELIDQALKLAPDAEKALLLAALAAGERQDFDASAAYFERLLKQLPPDSEEAHAVTDALAQLRAKKSDR